MGMMTTDDLKVKLDAANDKVAKRRNTIDKLCKKLGINSNDVVDGYSKEVNITKDDYLHHKTSAEIVAKFISEKPERLADGSWNNEAYDFNDKIHQLVDNLCKLFDVEKVAYNWQVKYDIAKNKENAPKIKVLVDFLDNWGEMAKGWYKNNAEALINAYNEYHDIVYDWLQEHNYSELGYTEKRELEKEFKEFALNTLDIHSRYRFSSPDKDDYVNQKYDYIDNLTKDLSGIIFQEEGENDYDSIFGYNSSKGQYVLKSFDDERLNKIIEGEKRAKYEDLCNRISAVVGEITDAQYLKIGAKGDIDGIVIGTKGKARVNTISAGGYNVQCYHYRCLVHKI